MTSCIPCNGLGRTTSPNPHWTPETPRQPLSGSGVHGRPGKVCEGCGGAGRLTITNMEGAA